MEYQEFLDRKDRSMQNQNDVAFSGFDISKKLYDFQRELTLWSLKKERSAIFADCGLGKTFMQLVWADCIADHTGGKVLIITPLAVSFQTVREGEKFGIEVINRRTGIHQGDRIVVTNYERLHYFDTNDFLGVVCDESSILKNFDGETRKSVTEFMRKTPYRLLCTATAAPNDYMELGTASEALGEMGFVDMLSMFFKKIEKTLSRKDEHRGGVYRFRGHSEKAFWRWICSWARAMRKPSDFGFDDGEFRLPPLNVREHIVSARQKADGMLFDVPAINLHEQRDELRRTINERCELAADLINTHHHPAVAWCHLNDEGHMLERLIPGSVEVEGSDSDEFKEEAFMGFARGDVRVIVSKPTIAGFGLNWQHCAHQTFFPSHSYEQYYQAVRRCWRFGQKKPVEIDLVTTEGEIGVSQNIKRKAIDMKKMFSMLVQYMNDEINITRSEIFPQKMEAPEWL